ncbi:MAG: hypothetical protein ACD_67C00048G0001 [uncultured bacterium]|nr:MAG: hypothetical protein ACD_67C00048G0001 [uncultured bacterium]
MKKGIFHFFILYGDNHAYAAVESPKHFGFFDVSIFQKVKDEVTFPTACVDDSLAVFRQDAGNIFEKSAAGNVGNAFDFESFDQGKNTFHINLGGREQFICNSFSETGKFIVDVETHDFENNFAGKGKPIAVKSA